VRFRLRETGHVPLDEQPDPVSRSMDAEDDFETHRFKNTLDNCTTLPYITV
jgi:hypothetical protein